MKPKYFWKVHISHIIQNHGKKLALLWVPYFQFNYGTYPIRQLSPLKLPMAMDSQCMQASSLKSISAPNVRRDFHIYIWQKCQNDVLCLNMNMDVSLTYWNLNSSSKELVLQWLLEFMLVYRSQKVKWYTFPKRFV